MLYVSDQKIASVGALADLDGEARAGVLADAERLYRYICRQDGFGIDEVALREYGERNDFPPDRLNAALGVLLETDRVSAIGEH